MGKPFRQFLVVDRGTTPQQGEDDYLHTTYRRVPYQEDTLRQWAQETFGTSEEATLADIARDIREGGWVLYEGIWPSEHDIEKPIMQRVAEAFQGDLEVDADKIAEALKGLGQRVNAKTVIAEVEDNRAVITITVTPRSRKNDRGRMIEKHLRRIACASNRASTGVHAGAPKPKEE